MRVYFIIFTLSWFILFISSCQNSCNYISSYYPKVHRGVLEYEKGNFKEAHRLLAKAFELCEPRNTQTINEIDVFIRLLAHFGEYKQCSEMIEEQLFKGYSISRFEQELAFSSFFESRIGRELILRSDDIQRDFLENCDTTVLNMLIEMLNDDQRARGTDGQKYFDSLNEKKLIWIFEEDRIPDNFLINCSGGEYLGINFHTILLHTRDSIRRSYFLPRMKELVTYGKLDPYIYGSLVDQYLLYNNSPQIYGTYSDRNGRLSDHVNLELLDKNRISIGLPTLSEKRELHQLKIKNYPDSYGSFFNQ